MKKTNIGILLVALLVITVKAHSQDKGIHFTQGLSWQQIKEKARKENKYIFVDCYATWCAPCRRMDAEVYPDTTLGSFVNRRFISVKVQMDSTKKDQESIRVWYADAHEIQRGYKVNVLPTFLFFTPDGKLAHRSAGFSMSAHFLKLTM